MPGGDPQHIIAQGRNRDHSKNQKQGRKQQMELPPAKVCDHQIQNRRHQHHHKIGSEEPVPAPENRQKHGHHFRYRSGFRHKYKKAAGHRHRPEHRGHPQLCQSCQPEGFFTQQVTRGDAINIYCTVNADLRKTQQIKGSGARLCMLHQAALAQNMLANDKKHGN